MTWQFLCLLASIFLFGLATIIAAGEGNFSHAAVLIPAGLTLFALSHVGGSHTP